MLYHVAAIIQREELSIIWLCWHPFEAVEDAVVQKTTHLGKSYDDHGLYRHQNPFPQSSPLLSKRKDRPIIRFGTCKTAGVAGIWYSTLSIFLQSSNSDRWRVYSLVFSFSKNDAFNSEFSISQTSFHLREESSICHLLYSWRQID